jgi:hypothetical protein
MSDTEGQQLDLTPGALQVIAAMQARVAAVAAEYGEHSPEHAEIADSLANALPACFSSAAGLPGMTSFPCSAPATSLTA